MAPYTNEELHKAKRDAMNAFGGPPREPSVVGTIPYGSTGPSSRLPKQEPDSFCDTVPQFLAEIALVFLALFAMAVVTLNWS